MEGGGNPVHLWPLHVVVDEWVLAGMLWALGCVMGMDEALSDVLAGYGNVVTNVQLNSDTW